jgi:predicted nucleotidyltransferase
MDMNVFRDKLRSRLGDNLLCLVHTGSRVRGEARADSDYDFTLVVSEIGRGVLDDIRDVLSDHSNISVYILDKRDLAYFPKAMCLQFVHSEKLYNEFDFPKPAAEDIDSYVNKMRRDEIDTLRHYLTLPHETSRVVRRIGLSLKYAYICLTYLVYKETGILPRTRLETIDYLEREGHQDLGVTLLKILENWSTQETTVLGNHREYLHMLEEFWRTLTD